MTGKRGEARASGGQALVETMLVMVVVLGTLVFASVQIALIGLAWIRANEAAQAGTRCAVVAEGSAAGEQARQAAALGVTYCLGAALPARVTVWDKRLDSGKARDHGGREIRMLSVHAYYLQNIMFGSVMPALAGRGIDGTYYLSVSRRYGHTGAVHCRMVRSPDPEYYRRAYPGAEMFDE